MRLKILFCRCIFFLMLLLLSMSSVAQTITTYVGPSLPRDGRQAITQATDSPSTVAADPAGGFYFVSPNQNRVYRVSFDGTLILVAGTGTYGFSGDGSRATYAQLARPWGIVLDAAHNAYITDVGNNRVRKVTPEGQITTVAQFEGLSGIAIDTKGTLYIAQLGGITELTAEGEVHTVAIPSLGSAAYRNSANSGQLAYPVGITVDAAGNVYIADCWNNQILKLTPDGLVTTIRLQLGSLYGASNLLSLSEPRSVAVDAFGYLYIADYKNNCIRKFSGDDPVSTISYPYLLEAEHGFAGELRGPSGIAVDAYGNLYAADTGSNRILKVMPIASGSDRFGQIFLVSSITAVAGSGTNGFSGDTGPATSARVDLDYRSGLALDPTGNLYIADTGNNRVRQVKPNGVITTVAGNGTYGISGGSATSAQLGMPSGVAVDGAGSLYIAESGTNRIRKVTNGLLIPVAGGSLGANPPGFVDGVTAVSAQLFTPLGVASDAAGNVYIADSNNRRIRMITPNGFIATVAGNGTNGFSGDGGPAISASLSDPSAIVTDASRNLYIADRGNNRIRKVTPNGTISTVVGTGVMGFSGDGGPAASASLSAPSGIALDTAGNLYIADRGNNRVRKVTATGTISTVAGNGVYGYSGDGSFAISAQFAAPSSLALDTAGNLYIADSGNDRIRKLELNTLPRVGRFPQVASGGGWKTTMTLVNLSTTVVTAHVNFYADAGTPLALPLILPDGSSITDSVANLTIQPGGSAVIESESLTTSINVGWAEVRASGFLGGYAIFRQRVAGMLDSEGTTQLETVASSSIVFAYDNAAGFQTGVALANLSADAATITAILRGEDGFFLGSVRFDMPGLGHSSFFLSSQFAATANRRGIIEFQNSSGDITGIGLRFSPSLSFTSVPSVR